jgi:hypothetical protein
LLPIPLALVYPGAGYLAPAAAARLRASDAERDIAVDILCAAVGDGRLTLDDLNERVAIALSARTRGELAVLIADLSDRRALDSRPFPPPAARACPGPETAAARPGSSRFSRWSQLQALIITQRLGPAAAGPATSGPR